MNIFTYRQADLNDLPSLKSVAVEAWSPYAEKFDPEFRSEFLADLSNDTLYTGLLKKSSCIVCESNSETVGIAFLIPGGNPTAIYESGWSYIRFVSVVPAYQGKGIGRELTKRCIDLARSNGERIVALHTSELMHKARHIYESLGFVVLKELPKRMGKRYWLYLLKLE